MLNGGLIRTHTLALALLVGLAARLPAQEPVRVDGRLTESGTGAGLAGGTVQLDGGPVLPTDVQGRFRIEGVAPGSHVLTARAYGYETREISLRLRADTSLVIELEPAPVPLPELLVEGRTVTVRGEVVERGSDRRLVDVEVRVDRGEPVLTDAHGRFELDDVAAGPPFRMSVRGFGFLPVETVVATSRDTALSIELEPDPVAQRMIAVQVERLEDRARSFPTPAMPALDRAFMLRRGNATALDLVIERYGQRLTRITCLVIDDGQRFISGAAPQGLGWQRGGGGGASPGVRRPEQGLEELSHFLASEIERIEVLQVGSFPRSYILRVYTRDFIREMVRGRVELTRPRVVAGFREPACW